MNKTIFVVLDACQYDFAETYFGYIEHRIDNLLGAKYKVRGELPSMSRPMYETLLTGLPVHMHGITNNDTVRLSTSDNLFSMCRAHNLSTAAAAYHWNSELYNHAPFDHLRDRIQLNSKGSIQNGIYYWEDNYPDSHVFADAEYLRTAFDPDFLLIHPMGIDYAGHKHGCESGDYKWAIVNADSILSNLMPVWIEEGYHVVVTADHGMNELGIHGGTDRLQRNTPLYIFSPKISNGRFTQKEISQLSIAPLLCRLLDIKPAEKMLQSLPFQFI